jgi:hypothetical protein
VALPEHDARSEEDFVIVGLTSDGRAFRPSDWADRLCGIMSQFGSDGRMKYSPYVQPVRLSGTIGVAVSARLRDIEPLAWNFLLGFARDNDLQMRAGLPVESADPAAGAGKAPDRA